MKEIVTKAVKRHLKLIEGNAALIVVDIQGGSVQEQKVRAEERREKATKGGITGVEALFVEGYLEIIPNAKMLIDACREMSMPVIWIQEWHRKNLVDFGRETDGTEGIHCLEGEPAVEVLKEIYPQEGEYIIRKTRYSCFLGTGLEFWLNGVNVLPGDTLLFIGGMTNVCVHYGAVDAHQRDYHIRIIEECVAGSSKRAHEAALEQMEYLQTGARVKLADMLVAIKAYKPVRPQKPGYFAGFVT